MGFTFVRTAQSLLTMIRHSFLKNYYVHGRLFQNIVLVLPSVKQARTYAHMNLNHKS
jgi:hypothetical protein